MGGKDGDFKLCGIVSLGLTSEVYLHKQKESIPWMLGHFCSSHSVLGLDILCGKRDIDMA
jgi:hypothetical protein